MVTTQPLVVTESSLSYWIARLALPVFFLADLSNKVIYIISGNDSPSFSPSQLVRILFELTALVLIAARPDKKRILIVSFIAILFGTYMVGQTLFLINYDHPFRYYYHFALYNKYVFLFITYAFLYRLRNENTFIERLMKTCEIIFIVNSVLILAGAVFELKLFRSYPFMDYRYGYNGVIPAVNESSFFYFIALSYVYYKKFIRKEKLGLTLLIPVSAFFLGTKAIYVLMAFMVLFHFIRVSTLKSRIFAFFGIFAFVILALLLYTSPYTQHIVDYFEHLVQQRGLLSAALSGRDEYVATKFFENLDVWTPLNYLFGGQDQMRFLIEMDVFDLFLYFGIIGSAIWYFLLFQTIFDFSLKKKFNLFFVTIYLLLAGLGGHFFASAVNSIYLVVFCLFIYSTDQQLTANKSQPSA